MGINSLEDKGITINGTVRDPQQEPLIGVNVHVKGTTIGTVTDMNGNYFLEVPNQNAVLEFSYIGFQTHEVRVGNQININVNMEGLRFTEKSICRWFYYSCRTRTITTRNDPCRI